MAEGIILKGIGGYYTVLDEGGHTDVVRPRGKFRNQRLSPVPGDKIRYVPPKEGVETEGAMEDILPRKNLLRRPKIANLDLAICVVSAQKPEPDFLMLDMLCACCALQGIDVLPVMNKSDLADRGHVERFLEDYQAFHPIALSAKTGAGTELLEARMAQRICCLAGQSGVGKTSLLNAIMPTLAFQTGGLSEKTERGRHTTRHAELILLKNGGMLADTPGFSLLELPVMDPAAFRDLYPEFAPYEGKCRFPGCLHDKEPDCAVKDAVRRHSISSSRWERYTILLDQVQKRWRTRYE